jgi:hypothetical protein
MVDMPVKLTLTRPQMFDSGGQRARRRMASLTAIMKQSFI